MHNLNIVFKVWNKRMVLLLQLMCDNALENSLLTLLRYITDVKIRRTKLAFFTDNMIVIMENPRESTYLK